MSSFRPLVGPAAIASAALLVGCAGGPAGPEQLVSANIVAAGAFDPVRAQITLCKVGTDATFDYTIGATSASVSLADGTCTALVTGAPPGTSATVTEQSNPGIVLDSVLVIRGIARTDEPFPRSVDTSRFTGTATVSGSGGLETGTVIVYFNHPAPPPPPPPPPPGGQGCTPGYWKQSQHFDSWVGYSPGQSFEAVFGRDVSGTPTLLQALGMNGGGINALMRHATAALLNASTGSGVNYGMTAAQVISAFQAAYDSGDYETQKNAFAARNEAGCPLN